MRGDRLGLIREQRGYTQAELAEMIGVGTQQIYRYENGKTEPDGDIVAKLARALNVTTDYLLGVTDTPLGTLAGFLSRDEGQAIEAWRNGDLMRAVWIIINQGGKLGEMPK